MLTIKATTTMIYSNNYKTNGDNECEHLDFL
jgi:hypothetical protein